MSGIGETIVVAVRSAISAIALIAVFDRQFILSKWLHWALQNWKALLNALFALVPIGIPEPNRPFLAFLVIVIGTVAFDATVRWRDAKASRTVFVLFLFTASLALAVGFLPIGTDPSKLSLLVPLIALPMIVILGATISPRMFAWLVAFTVAFIGLNEFALWFERTVPLPPAG